MTARYVKRAPAVNGVRLPWSVSAGRVGPAGATGYGPVEVSRSLCRAPD